MKRYISIDHIYVEKLAELCGESFYDSNSYNLLLCERLHKLDYSWKVIYFALLEYRSWYNKKWYDEHLMSYSSWGFEEKMYFGNNKYDPEGHKLDYFLCRTHNNIDEYMTAEEFFFRNMEK